MKSVEETEVNVSTRQKVLVLTGLLLLASAESVNAQQDYCVHASSGRQVRAGATLVEGKRMLRCCRKAPVSGVPSNAALLEEEQFKKIWNPKRC